MGLVVTKKEMTKIRSTAFVLGVICLLFVGLALIFNFATPQKMSIQGFGAENERISVVEGENGDSLYLLSDEHFTRFDSFTHEKIANFDTNEIKDLLTKDGKINSLAEGSLAQWTATYMRAESKHGFVLVDRCGNIFKIYEDGNQFKLDKDDYYLVGKNEARTSKGFDCKGDDLFFLNIERGGLYIDKFDFANLKGGVIEDKMVWELGEDKGNGVQEIVPMKTDTGILSFVVDGDTLLILKDGGGIVTLSTDLVDMYDGDKKVNYFDAVKSGEVVGWQQSYDDAEKEYWIQSILKWVSKYTEAELQSKTRAELEAILLAEKPTKVSTVAEEAKKHASEQAGDKYIVDGDWFIDFSDAEKTLTVKRESLEKNSKYYSVFYKGVDVIRGMVFSPKNKALYYANDVDGYMYSISKEELINMPIGGFLSDYAKPIETVARKKTQNYSSFGNGIEINKYANTIYVKYENSRSVSIVDINDPNNCRIVRTFEADFEMHSFTGDKDNKVTHGIQQVVKVDLSAREQTNFYLNTYESERFEHKSLIRTLFVVCLGLAVLIGIVAIWLFVSSRSKASTGKILFIVKDTKKNKFVYLVLVFYVVALLLFCYYEAIGAIAMSFFDYTLEKPAWVWNNFANYIKIFNDPYLVSSAINMIFFLVFDLFLSIVPPLIFAILLILIRNKVTSNWIRSLMFIPGIIPSIAGMLIWRIGIYGDDGVLNQIIMSWGGEPVKWLTDVAVARWSLIMMGFPFIGGYLIFYGGMMNVPQEYHEAGRLEGLGIIKQFIKIDIPLIFPQIKYIFITTFIGSVQNFARTHVLKSTAVKTPVQTMYEYMTQHFNYGMSSAYATLIFVFLFVAVAMNFKMQRKDAMGDDL